MRFSKSTPVWLGGRRSKRGGVSGAFSARARRVRAGMRSERSRSLGLNGRVKRSEARVNLREEQQLETWLLVHIELRAEVSGVVGTADERAGGDVAKAFFQRDLFVTIEGVRVDVVDHREVTL